MACVTRLLGPGVALTGNVCEARCRLFLMFTMWFYVSSEYVLRCSRCGIDYVFGGHLILGDTFDRRSEMDLVTGTRADH